MPRHGHVFRTGILFILLTKFFKGDISTDEADTMGCYVEIFPVVTWQVSG